MHAKTIAIWIVVLALGVPIGWFIFSNLKAGWDQAERDKATAATQPPASVPAAPIAAPSTAFPDLAKMDFSHNTTTVDNHTDHHVEDLPSQNGSGTNSSTSGMIAQGDFDVRATIETLTSASLVNVPSAEHSGGLVTLDIAVTEGTIRAYLHGQSGAFISGYVFTEASPNHPGRVIGYPEDWSDTGSPHQSFTLESKSGTARGITIHMSRANP